MRELNDTEKQQLAQHKLWLASNGEEGARLFWSGAILSYANLSGANLSYAILRDAILRDAILRDAILSDANLLSAYLSGANLSGANLVGADLSGADLRSADLRGADLFSADLRGADLSGATGYIGFTSVGSGGRTLHCIMHADGWHCYTGCFGDTLDALEAAVERVHKDDVYGVQYREIIARLRAMEQNYKEEVK